MITGNWNLDVKTETGWKTKEGFSHRNQARNARKNFLAEKNKVDVSELKSTQLGDTTVLVRKGW